MSIHPTAIIEDTVVLGSNVEVGPYSVLRGGVKLGDDVRVGPHVVIEGNTDIGAGTNIFQFASIGAAPQDLKYRGEDSKLLIGEKNIIREFVTINPGTESGGMVTQIGNQNLMMATSHVAHDCKVGNNCVIANSVALAGHVEVGSNVILGGLSAVHQFCRLGDFALIAGGAMVNKDVPPYCIAQGDRAVLRGINAVGLKRGGFDADALKVVKKAYLHLIKNKEPVDSLQAEVLEHPAVRFLADFIVNSSRGLAFEMGDAA